MKYLSRPEELVLLTIWKLTEDAYGVNIRKFIGEMTNKYWSIGAIYVPLDRLEHKGYISSYLANPTSQRGGKSKRYYKLTKTGLEQLGEIQKIYKTFWSDIPDLWSEIG
jgi:DNA-binding PadR family transcriptional regulator